MAQVKDILAPQEIDRHFADVERPDFTDLGRRGTQEWEGVLRRLSEKTWRNVTESDFDSQDGLLGTLSVLSGKGFLYFMPGLLRLAANQEDDCQRRSCLSGLILWFTRPDYLKPDPEIAICLHALSGPQRDFLIRLIEAARSEDATESTLCPIIFESAILSLRTQDHRFYSQKELEAWNAELVSKYNECHPSNPVCIGLTSRGKPSD